MLWVNADPISEHTEGGGSAGEDERNVQGSTDLVNMFIIE